MTIVRRAVTLLASLALSLALAAPATASASKQSVPAWACSPEDTAAAAWGGAAARGTAVDSNGRVREKDTGQVVRDLPASAKGKAPASSTVTVPVWWHVITDGGAGALSDSDIRNQVRVMSNAFSGGAGGAATGFTFTLAGITRTDDAVWYALKSAGAEHEMKRALKRGDDGTLNVYSGAAGGYLGYAYLPEITDTAQAYLDGIVIDWETLPGVSDTYGGGYADEGDTMVHETGHWLNLEHTFFGQCNKSGDFVDDTPAQKSATSGCPEGKNTCPAPGIDPIHNYMDYSDDSCIFEFTPGQAQRMRDAWLFWRAS
jgi:Pregnancy-associated plasma protein-A